MTEIVKTAGFLAGAAVLAGVVLTTLS